MIELKNQFVIWTGKSSLTIQFVENQFVDAYDPTIENTFQKQLKHNGTVYDLMIVDTAGQDEYSIFPQVHSWVDLENRTRKIDTFVWFLSLCQI